MLMENRIIRPATPADVTAIMAVMDAARQTMRGAGNPNQ